jgi:hypothetical protein
LICFCFSCSFCDFRPLPYLCFLLFLNFFNPFFYSFKFFRLRVSLFLQPNCDDADRRDSVYPIPS